jgi:hypothetical protein
MPAAVPYGCHEGSRSEYLAQYVFGSWGTAVVTPRQEDHGIDLACTLMKQVGGRFLATIPYTVQVKSTMGPVIFEGEEVVRWLVEHPLPFFLCVVNKKSGRLSVYQTLARFLVWTIGRWPEKVELVPAAPVAGQVGRSPQWPGNYTFSLDQPILDFTVNDMLDQGFWDQARAVFEYWVKFDNDNATRVRARLPRCCFPSEYRTNEPGRGLMGGWLQHPTREQFDETSASMEEFLAWVGGQLAQRRDMAGAAKAAQLHRHLFYDDGRSPPSAAAAPLSMVHWELNPRLHRQGYTYAGVDYLAELVKNALGDDGSVKAPGPGLMP